MKLRINESKEVLYNFPFSDSKDVYEKMKEYTKADRELFMVMYLNAKNHVIDCELHSIGAVNTTVVHCREVMRGALLANACSIICVHNHPSGEVTPSASDDQITGEIVKAGVVLQIMVLDHIIIGTEGYYSYADEGRIGEMEAEAGKSPCQGHAHVAEGGVKDNDRIRALTAVVLKGGVVLPPSLYCCSALLALEDGGVIEPAVLRLRAEDEEQPIFIFKKSKQMVISCPFCREILIKGGKS